MLLGLVQKHLTIGELALRAGVGVETIRFYERKGLITQPARSAVGFCAYPRDVVARLGFVHEAKQLGFTLKEIRDLLRLRDNPQSDAAVVHGHASQRAFQRKPPICPSRTCVSFPGISPHRDSIHIELSLKPRKPCMENG